jgi:antitoxin component YwqK of YwqJK toxin-antitoxin module
MIKKNSLILFSFLISTIAFSQNLQVSNFPDLSDTIQFDIYEQTDQITNQNIIYFYLKGTNKYVAKLIESEYEQYLKGGTPTSSHTMTYSLSNFDSTMNFYDQHNRLYSSYQYTNGIKSKNSVFYSYHDSDTNIRLIENYTDNVYNGKVLFYHKNGQLKKESTFIKNKAEGRCISYFENGNINILHHHENGKQTGLYFKYYINGELERKGYLNKDKGIGKWIYYYPNGKLKEKGFEIKNKRNGWWFFYNNLGEFTHPKYYKNGKVKDVPEELGINLQKLELKE